ncbi:MAG TPA: ATP-binding cassette domain-containing protein, partial [Flavobacterium sp.]|nr:ATP-binding cassette domain-containing protein [Flavobacterium sp.]
MINQVKNSKKVVEIINLKKSFGNQIILQNISLSLMEGENLVILGKSGSGKSVLIKCLIGLLTTDSGQINVFEENMNSSTGKELALLREKIGFLFQSSALYDSMTVRQNLEFPLRRIKKNLTEN